MGLCESSSHSNEGKSLQELMGEINDTQENRLNLIWHSQFRTDFWYLVNYLQSMLSTSTAWRPKHNRKHSRYQCAHTRLYFRNLVSIVYHPHRV